MNLAFRKWLFGIIILAFLLRLYSINTPLADWHSFRQADTASVTREYVKHGIDLLHPRYQDLSNIQSGKQNAGKDNVEGWRMVEFPIINGVLAYILKIFPFLDLVIVSRLASVFASLLSLVCLVYIVKNVYSPRIALWTGFIFATLPYSVYYSRTILPEPFFIALSLGSLALFTVYCEKKHIQYAVVSAVVFAIALLVKPMAIFFAPVFLAIWYMHFRKITVREVQLSIIFAASVIPLLLWRKWITQFPLGIPSSDWLYNGGGPEYALSPLYRIRFRPAWFRWIFYERLTKLFLGYTGTIFFGVSFIQAATLLRSKEMKKAVFLFVWAFGALAYVTVFAAGNVQHDYYQALLTPFISIATGVGIVTLWDTLKKKTSTMIACTMISLLMVTMYVFSLKQVGGYYNINNWDIVIAGQTVDKLLPADAKVIAPYQGDTAFLFQTNRTGWPIGFDIDTKIKEGAQYYVSVNYDDEARELEKKYKTIEKNSHFILLDLRQKES